MINTLLEITKRLSLMSLREMKDRQDELQLKFMEANRNKILADELNISIILEAHLIANMLLDVSFKQSMVDQSRRH